MLIIDELVQLEARRNGLKRLVFNDDVHRIEYWISDSEGPPLLLLHAFAATCLYSWRTQIAALEKHYRLILPNMLFFGDSEIIPKKYTIEDQTNAISSLMNHLGISEFYLGGASYGGSVAYKLTQSKTFKVRKLFLTNVPLILINDNEWNQVMKDFEVQSKAEILVPSNHKQLHKLYKRSRYSISILPSIFFKRVYKFLYLPYTFDRRSLVQSFIGQKNQDLKELDIPTLLLWGSNDSLVPIENAVLLKEKLGPKTKLIEIQKTGHMPNLERPRLYNKELIQFLLDNEA